MHRSCRGQASLLSLKQSLNLVLIQLLPLLTANLWTNWIFLIPFSLDLPFHTRSAPPQAPPPILHHSVNKLWSLVTYSIDQGNMLSHSVHLRKTKLFHRLICFLQVSAGSLESVTLHFIRIDKCRKKVEVKKRATLKGNFNTSCCSERNSSSWSPPPSSTSSMDLL